MWFIFISMGFLSVDGKTPNFVGVHTFRSIFLLSEEKYSIKKNLSQKCQKVSYIIFSTVCNV